MDAMLGTDEMLTVAEFAEIAGMERPTLMKKIRFGELPIVRVSPRKILIPTKHLSADKLAEVRDQVAYIQSYRSQQSVYFIRAESGPIKIGIALDPAERLAGLQISHFEKLSLLTTAPGGIRLETKLHHRFAHLRIRGEWFRPAPELLAEIARLQP